MSTFTAHDFPGFYTPYFSLLTFPVAGIAAIATKYFCYRCFSTNQNRPDFSDVMFAICGSFLAGMFTLFLAGSLIETFPSINNFPLIRIIESLVEYFATRNLLTFIVITFFIACALSIISEFVALQFLTSDDKVDNLFLMSAIANFASYVVQAIIVWAWVIWIW